MPTNAPSFQLLAPPFIAPPCNEGVGEVTGPDSTVEAATDVAEAKLVSCDERVITKSINSMANAELAAAGFEFVSSITPLTT